jgi:hypothetical protein
MTLGENVPMSTHSGQTVGSDQDEAPKVPDFIDPHKRAREAAEEAREELRLDAADDTGSGVHAARAAALASLAVYERLGVLELFAEFGPKVMDELLDRQIKARASDARYQAIEAAGTKVEAWFSRVEARMDSWSESYEQWLRKRSL